ncbi:hypothetical protein ILYODFUR_017305, partial [Ilyodon furcidens]
CSVTCGNGTQQRQALCHTRDNTIGLCLDSKPDTIRVCRMEPCRKGSSDLNKNGNILIHWLSRPNPNYPRISSRLSCTRDRSVFCHMEALQRYCSLPDYWRLCCKTCNSINSTKAEPNSTDIVTTPGPIDDFITPSDEAVTVTNPYSDSTVTSSGEDTETSWTFPSGDDIKESYSSSLGVTDTVVLEDSLSMMIPTINGEDTTSPPWLDLPEYISVGVPIPTMTSDLPGTPVPTVESHTKEEQVTLTPEIISTLKPQQNVAEYNERNSIDVFDNRVVGVDSDVSQNNLIPKHRVSLREQTKNKRIQELLEEKRNFVLRMKRGHTEQ